MLVIGTKWLLNGSNFNYLQCCFWAPQSPVTHISHSFRVSLSPPPVLLPFSPLLVLEEKEKEKPRIQERQRQRVWKRIGRMAFAGTTQKCMACDKTVYLVDKLTADNRIYHKACFRCHHCKGTLKVCCFNDHSVFSIFLFVPCTYLLLLSVCPPIPHSLIILICTLFLFFYVFDAVNHDLFVDGHCCS